MLDHVCILMIGLLVQMNHIGIMGVCFCISDRFGARSIVNRLINEFDFLQNFRFGLEFALQVDSELFLSAEMVLDVFEG